MSKKYSQQAINAMDKMQKIGMSANDIAQAFAHLYPGITRCAVLGVLFRERRKA